MENEVRTEERNKIQATQYASMSGDSTAFGGGEIIQEKLDYLEIKIKKYEDKIEETKNIFEQKIESSRIKIIETLGVFVALFTFVSVEFQMFRIFHTPASISGLTLILLGSLISFLAILDFVINKFDDLKKKFILLLIYSVGLMSSGVYIFVSFPQEKLSIGNEVKIENKGSSVQINENSIKKLNVK